VLAQDLEQVASLHSQDEDGQEALLRITVVTSDEETFTLLARRDELVHQAIALGLALETEEELEERGGRKLELVLFGGEPVLAEECFEDHGVEDGARMSVSLKQVASNKKPGLIIMTLTGKKILLDQQPPGVGWTMFCPDTTVETVKCIIQDIEGISPDAMRLVAMQWGARKAVLMEDYHTLGYYDIQECDPEEGRTIGLALNIRSNPIEEDLQRVASETESSRDNNDADASCDTEHIIIDVEARSGHTIAVHAFPSTTISTIRAVVYGKSGKRLTRLIFAGATLEPGRTLRDYNIVLGYSSGVSYKLYEVLSYGEAPADPCDDRWDSSDAEVMAMNGVQL